MQNIQQIYNYNLTSWKYPSVYKLCSYILWIIVCTGLGFSWQGMENYQSSNRACHCVPDGWDIPLLKLQWHLRSVDLQWHVCQCSGQPSVINDCDLRCLARIFCRNRQALTQNHISLAFFNFYVYVCISKKYIHTIYIYFIFLCKL